MSVLRQDPTTGGWVIVAPGRRDRPHVESHKASAKHAHPCPLCPGFESETPAELWRVPAAQDGPWAVRVVPNKFAVLSPSKAEVAAREEAGLLREQDGVGHHELIVDSPQHDRRIGEMSTSEIAQVLDAYYARYTELRRDPRVAYVIVFKNSGGRAGASLDHPHSQLVATPMAPLGLERRFVRARAHYDETGRCLYCDVLDVERQTRHRLVQESEQFLVSCPFASGVPFEIWIVPKRHQPSFGATERSERIELGALDAALDRPDFNYVLHTAPVADEDKPYYLWHLQILPRIATLAGFELGSGIPINTTFPEDAAASLRSALDAEMRT